MHTDTVSIEQFITDHKITITSERWHENPLMLGSREMDHWKCKLRMHTKTMTLIFSMGYGHGGHSPEVADVLSCLASDASSAGMTFEEFCSEFGYDEDQFCSEFGYDEDPRKAERTYKAVEHQDKRLRNFLGEDLYETLIQRVEVL